jgi:hypothetical protein
VEGGKDTYRTASRVAVGTWRALGLVRVRIASCSCSAEMIQKTVSSRKFPLRDSVVGDMR